MGYFVLTWIVTITNAIVPYATVPGNACSSLPACPQLGTDVIPAVVTKRPSFERRF